MHLVHYPLLKNSPVPQLFTPTNSSKVMHYSFESLVIRNKLSLHLQEDPY